MTFSSSATAQLLLGGVVAYKDIVFGLMIKFLLLVIATQILQCVDSKIAQFTLRFSERWIWSSGLKRNPSCLTPFLIIVVPSCLTPFLVSVVYMCVCVCSLVNSVLCQWSVVVLFFLNQILVMISLIIFFDLCDDHNVFGHISTLILWKRPIQQPSNLHVLLLSKIYKKLT